MADLNAVDEVASLKKRVRELEVRLEEETREKRRHIRIAELEGRWASDKVEKEAPQTADAPALQVAHPLVEGAQPSTAPKDYLAMNEDITKFVREQTVQHRGCIETLTEKHRSMHHDFEVFEMQKYDKAMSMKEKLMEKISQYYERHAPQTADAPPPPQVAHPLVEGAQPSTTKGDKLLALSNSLDVMHAKQADSDKEALAELATNTNELMSKYSGDYYSNSRETVKEMMAFRREIMASLAQER